MKTLFAEDDPVSRRLVEKLLVQWGYEVVIAKDGEEAWWVLQREDAPRLAILDWMMPGMSGPQICREVRKRLGEPYVYILLLTAKSQKQDTVEGMEAGADDYLTKPFDPDELRVRLRAGRRILSLQEHILSMQDAMRFPATHDPLTGLWNREAIVGMLRHKLAHDRRDAPIGVILVDIDGFGHMNNTYGSQASDAVLREAARRLRSGIRLYDSVGRYGKSEFLVLVPACYSSEVVTEAENLRARIEREPVDVLGCTIAVTVSIGVATTEEIKGADSLVLLEAAGEAVRRAKIRGRNQVELAPATERRGLPHKDADVPRTLE